MKLFILAFSLLIAFFASAQTGNTKVKWLTHTDSVYNLTIDYPSDWQLKPSTQKACFFVTSYPESDKDNFRENLNCIIPKDINKGTTIQMVEKEIVNTLSESFSDFKIVHSGYLEWNNVSAYEIEYTYTETSNNVKSYLHMLQKMAIIKGKFYTLTYTSMSDSYEKYISIIRRIFQSFKVL